MPVFYTSKDFLKHARKLNPQAEIRVDPKLHEKETYAVHGIKPGKPLRENVLGMKGGPMEKRRGR